MKAAQYDLVGMVSSLSKKYVPGSKKYEVVKKKARLEAEKVFGEKAPQGPVVLKPFGKIVFPFYPMGSNVSSINLFDLDELIIFSFYWQNRGRYKNVADIGANIGLHSILLSRCGFNVRSYEPDPEHYKILKKNLSVNQCQHVSTFNAAVSSVASTKEFVRVLGNTTGSHLAGSKKDPYGKLERFLVETQSIVKIMRWADLIKIDAEGHEKDIILATKPVDWQGKDAMVEVQNKENAKAIFDHFKNSSIGLFAQKKEWAKVVTEDEMPNGYKEGSLLIKGSIQEE